MESFISLLVIVLVWIGVGRRLKKQDIKIQELEGEVEELVRQTARLNQRTSELKTGQENVFAAEDRKADQDGDEEDAAGSKPPVVVDTEGAPWQEEGSEQPLEVELEDTPELPVAGETAGTSGQDVIVSLEPTEIKPEEAEPAAKEVAEEPEGLEVLADEETQEGVTEAVPFYAPIDTDAETKVVPPNPWKGTVVGKLDQTTPVATDTVEPFETAGPQHGDLEQRLSTNWLVWVGGVALALAGVFLVRYIAEQGWLSPAMRCAIGVVFGVILVSSGEFVRRRPLERAIAAIRPDYVPQALTAAGLVTAFGSVYLAYAFYDLLPSGWSFILLAAIALSAFALSLSQGAFVALLGLAGAVATPALVSTQDPSNWGFFSYLGIIVLSTLAVADRRQWYWLPELSLIATAGWAGIWIMQLFRNADILPIGVTTGIVALGGLALASRANRHSESKVGNEHLSVPPDAVAWTGLTLAGASAAVLALYSDFFSTAHWLLLSFGIVAGLIVRVTPRFELALPGITLISVVTFGLVYVDETALQNLSERLMGWPAPTHYLLDKYQSFRLHAGLIAIALYVGGLQALWRSSQAIVQSLVTGAVPLVLLLIGYVQFRHLSGDGIWVLAAIVALVAFIFATLLSRHKLENQILVQSVYAAFAVFAAFIALTFQLDRIWLTIGYSGLVLVVALISLRADYQVLRNIVNLIVLVILVRLTINPDLRAYEFFYPLGMHWVIYGYLVPTAIFVAASRVLKRAKDDLTVTVLEGGALILGVMLVSIEIRIFMTGTIYSGGYSLSEASLQTIAWLTSALVLAHRNLRYPRIFSTWGSRILTVLGGLQAIVLQLLLMNPIFTGEYIEGYGLFNMMILSMFVPAVLLWLIASVLLPSEQQKEGSGRLALTVLRAGSVLLLFAFITQEIRVFFQGMRIRPQHTSLLELYVTTLGWLLPASMPYLFLRERKLPHVRSFAQLVVLFSFAVLILGHAMSFNPAVTGEIVRGWPVVNTLLIGFVIPAALLYMLAHKLEGTQRYVLVVGAYVLVFIWTWLAIKNAFQGAQMGVLHNSLLELYITTLVWMLLGASPFFVARIGDMTDARQAGYAILAVSVGMLFAGHAFNFNPVFDQSFVPGGPVFNVLLVGFIAPAALLGMIAGRLDDELKLVAQILAYVLLLIGVTMLVKQAFQGEVLRLETLTDSEDYGYSIAWLVLAITTMIVGISKNNSHVRYASLGVLLLVVLKVFLLDMSGLGGLWRVASLFGLGIGLVGIGFIYQRFMYAQQTGSARARVKER